MGKGPVISAKAVTDFSRKIRKKLEQRPGLMTTTRVEGEIIRDHLMKARMSLPMAGVDFGVEYTIFSDEPPVAGGEGAAPFMFGYFMAGALFCEMAQIVWNAESLGLVDAIKSVEMTLEGDFAMGPLFDMDDTKGASTIKEMRVTTRIEADARPELIEKLARLAGARCPAHQSLVNKVPYSTTVELNGEKIAEFRDE